MRHPRATAFEDRLKAVFDDIDRELESRHAGMPLLPQRAVAGTTSNPEHDGLFNVGASFTAGFGSGIGRGYVVDVRMLTIPSVSAARQEELEEEVAGMLRERLPAAFPGRELQVTRDGHVFKIHGDLSLGKL